jgi:predicted nucleic acid-binding protein
VFLVDTSAWIEFFRKGSQVDPGSIVDLDEIVTCLPVIQEVLQGFQDERAFRIASESMRGFPIVELPMPAELFDEAVNLYRSARRLGLTVRPGVDCIIAACAIRHGLTVLHHGRDFDHLAKVSSLRCMDILSRSSS